MGKVAVVFWSGSGNTEEMAKAVLNGAKDAGAEAELFEVESFGADKLADFDAIAFGCPAMGDEVLEETVFEPAFAELEDQLQDKKVALFGSYGWGDGEWMRSWEERCKEHGVNLAAESVIANDAPDEDGVKACEALGAALA